jgi:hypothetical protein
MGLQRKPPDICAYTDICVRWVSVGFLEQLEGSVMTLAKHSRDIANKKS